MLLKLDTINQMRQEGTLSSRFDAGMVRKVLCLSFSQIALRNPFDLLHLREH